jgi:hypothetical protein
MFDFIDANMYLLRYSLYMYMNTVAPSRELLSVVYGDLSCRL